MPGGTCRPRGRPPRNPPPPPPTNTRSRRGKKRSPSNRSSAESTFRSSSRESSRSSKSLDDLEGCEEDGEQPLHRQKLYDSDEKIHNPYREDTPPSSEDDHHYFISGIGIEKQMKLTYYEEFGVEDEIRETKDPDFHKERYKVVRAEHVKQKPKTKNVDICVVCEEPSEDMVKCVRCPAAFHRTCIEGTMSLVKPKYEQWTCKRCRYEQHVLKRPRRVAKTLPFDEEERLVSSVDSHIQLLKEDGERVNHNTFFDLVAGLANPKSFTLRKELADKLEDVPYMEHVPRKEEAPVETPCFHCRFETSIERPGILCDYCPAVFHIHCLDPPMTTVLNEFWMCPLHPEYAIDTYAVNSVSISKRMKLWKEYQKKTNPKKEFKKAMRKMRAEAEFEKRGPPVRRIAEVPGFIEFAYGCKPDKAIPLNAPGRDSDDDVDINDDTFFDTPPVDREPLYDATEQDTVQMKHAFCAYMKNKKLTEAKGDNDVRLASFTNNWRSQKDAEFTTVDQCYYPETPYQQTQEIYALFEHVCSEIRTKFPYLLEAPGVRPTHVRRIQTIVKSFTPTGTYQPVSDEKLRDLAAMPPPPLPYATRFKKPEFLQQVSTHDLFDGQFCFPLLTLADDMYYFARYYSDGQNIIMKIERLPDEMMEPGFKHPDRTEEELKKFPEQFAVSMPLIERRFEEAMVDRRKRKIRMPKLDFFVAKQKKMDKELRTIREWEAAKVIRAAEIKAWELKKEEFEASIKPTRDAYAKALATDASNLIEKTSKGFYESPDIRRRFRKDTMELNRTKKQNEELDRVMAEFESTKPEDIPDLDWTPKKLAKWQKRIRCGYKPNSLMQVIKKTHYSQVPVPKVVNKKTRAQYFRKKKALMDVRRVALKKFIGWMKGKRYNMKRELRYLESDFKPKKPPLIRLLESRNKDVHGPCVLLGDTDFKKLLPIECRKIGDNLYLAMLEMDGDTWQVLRRLNYNDMVMAFPQTIDIRRKLMTGESDCHVAGEIRPTNYSELRVAAIIFEKRERIRTSKYAVNAGLFNQWFKELKRTTEGEPILDSRFTHLKDPIFGTLGVEKPYHSYANIPLYHPMCIFGTGREAHIDLMLLAPRCQYIRLHHFKITYSRIDMLAKVTPMDGYLVHDGVLYGEDPFAPRFDVDCDCTRRLKAARRFPGHMDGFLVNTDSRFMVGCLEFSVFLMEPEFLWNQIPELTPDISIFPNALEVEPNMDAGLVPFEGEFNYDKYLTPEDFQRMAPDEAMLKSDDECNRRSRHARKRHYTTVKRIPIELTDMQLPASETATTEKPAPVPPPKPVKKTRRQKVAEYLIRIKRQARRERRQRIRRRWRTAVTKITLERSVTAANLEIADKTLKDVQDEIKRKIKEENERSSQEWREKRKKGRGRGKKAPVNPDDPPPPPKPRAPRTPKVPKPVVPFVQTSGPVTRASRKRGYFGDVQPEVFLALPLNPPPRKRKPKEPPPEPVEEPTPEPFEPEPSEVSDAPVEEMDPPPAESADVVMEEPEPVEPMEEVVEPVIPAAAETLEAVPAEATPPESSESVEAVPEETMDMSLPETSTQEGTEPSSNALEPATSEPVDTPSEAADPSATEPENPPLDEAAAKKRAAQLVLYKRYLKRLAKHNAKRVKKGLEPLPPRKRRRQKTDDTVKRPKPKKQPKSKKEPKPAPQQDVFVWVPPENMGQLKLKLRRQRVTEQPPAPEEQPKPKKGHKSKKRSKSKNSSKRQERSNPEAQPEEQQQLTRRLRSQTRSKVVTPSTSQERPKRVVHPPSTRRLRSQTRLDAIQGTTHQEELVLKRIPDVNLNPRRRTYYRQSKAEALRIMPQPYAQLVTPKYEEDAELPERPSRPKKQLKSKKRLSIKKPSTSKEQRKSLKRPKMKKGSKTKPSKLPKQPKPEGKREAKPRRRHQRQSKTAAMAAIERSILEKRPELQKQPDPVEPLQPMRRLRSQRHLEAEVPKTPQKQPNPVKTPKSKRLALQKQPKPEELEVGPRRSYQRKSKTMAQAFLERSTSAKRSKSKKLSKPDEPSKPTRRLKSQERPKTKKPSTLQRRRNPVPEEPLAPRRTSQRKSKTKAYARIKRVKPVEQPKPEEQPNPRKRRALRRDSTKELESKKRRLSKERPKSTRLRQSQVLPDAKRVKKPVASKDVTKSKKSNKDKSTKSTKKSEKKQQSEATLFYQQIAAEQAELILALGRETNMSEDDVNLMLAAVPYIDTVTTLPKSSRTTKAEVVVVPEPEKPKEDEKKPVKQKATPKRKVGRKTPKRAAAEVATPSEAVSAEPSKSQGAYTESSTPHEAHAEPATSYEAYSQPSTSYEAYAQPSTSHEAYSLPTTSQQAYADTTSYEPAAEYQYEPEPEPVATTSAESDHVAGPSAVVDPNLAYYYEHPEEYEQPAEAYVMEVDPTYQVQYQEQYHEHYQEQYEQQPPAADDGNSDDEIDILN
uniref:PHD-type domain-containing protein n=1 Tax=Panagrellus redivivus TaxID=6233 RepID=A0A7E4UQM5_PANRE